MNNANALKTAATNFNTAAVKAATTAAVALEKANTSSTAADTTSSAADDSIADTNVTTATAAKNTADGLATTAATNLALATAYANVPVVMALDGINGFETGFSVTAGAVVTVMVGTSTVNVSEKFTKTTESGVDTYTAKVGAFDGSETTIAVSAVMQAMVGSATISSVAATIADLDIDTTAPVAPTVNSIEGGGTVNAADVTDGLQVTGTAEAGSTVSVQMAGTTKTTTAGTDGAFSVTFTGSEVPTFGSYGVDVKATDAAGNVSALTSPTISIDTKADADGTPLSIAIATDNEVTNLAESTAVAFTLAGIDSDAASVAVVFTDTDETNTATVTVNATKVNGIWTVSTANLSTLTDGTITATVTVTDTAGNTATATDTLMLDKFITQTTVALANDTTDGVTGNDEDSITNDASLTLSTLDADATRTYQIGTGSDATAAAAAAGNATASSTYTMPTADGVYNVIVTDTDGAGNTSTANVTFTLDTTIATPTVSLTTDTFGGTGTNDDLYTNTAELTFSTTASDVTRKYKINDGQLTDTYTAPVTSGNYTVTVFDTDKAGNTAQQSISFTLDTAAAAPTINTVATDNTVNLAESTNLVISGTGEAGAVVTLAVANQTATVGEDGNWSITVANAATTFDQGAETLSVTQVDKAGNTSTAGTRNITVDTIAANAPVISLQASSDNGSSPTDRISSIATPVLDVNLTGSGALEGDVVRLYAGSTQVGMAILSASNIANNAVSITTSNLGNDGVYSLKANITDVAGNVSADSTAISYTLDAVNAAPTVNFVSASSTGFIIAATDADAEPNYNSLQMVTAVNGTTAVNNGTNTSFTVGATTSGGDVALVVTDGTNQAAVLFEGQALTLTMLTNAANNVVAGDSASLIYGFGGNDTIAGYDFNDIIFGGAGNDTLSGGFGINILTGEAGLDKFVFDAMATQSQTALTTITDYTVVDDSIQLSKAVFEALGSVGALSEAEFQSGADMTAATTETARIIYNTTDGKLYYDADGSVETVAAVHIGTLSNLAALTYQEFSIIA